MPHDQSKLWLARFAAGIAACGYLFALFYSLVFKWVHWAHTTPVFANWIWLSAVIGGTYVFVGIYYLVSGIGRAGLMRMARAISWKGGGFVLALILSVRLVMHWIHGSAGVPLEVILDGGNSIFVRSATLPGIFLVSHCVYWGPMFIVLGLFWSEICRLGRERGYGVLAFLTLSLLMSITSESRHLSHVYPLIVVLGLVAMQRASMQRRLLPIVVIGSIVSSKIWYGITVEQMRGLDAFTGLIEFPWQRYFMHFGPWISPSMYLVQGGVALVFMLVILWLVAAGPREVPVAAAADDLRGGR